MKVLMINGSPHKEGTTYRALKEIADTLQVNGVDSEILTIGNMEIGGCKACGYCSKTGKCVKDDVVNQVISKIEDADGLVIGSPVYYAGLNGTLKSLLDRVFYARKGFDGKPAAAIAVARRAGTTSTVDIINKYFMISNMPVVSSQYWNMVFGSNAEQATLDQEGMQTMRTLANNMAWLIKCIKAGKDNGVDIPEREKTTRTNFIK